MSDTLERVRDWFNARRGKRLRVTCGDVAGTAEATDTLLARWVDIIAMPGGGPRRVVLHGENIRHVYSAGLLANSLIEFGDVLRIARLSDPGGRLWVDEWRVAEDPAACGHPSGVNLAAIPPTQAIDINPNDELFGDNTADDIGAIAGEMAELLLAGGREKSHDWMLIAAKVLNKYYVAHRIKVVVTYDRSSGKIVLLNSIV